MLANVTIDREDANAPKEFLKAGLVARYASTGERNQADVEEIETALNVWVRKTARSVLELKNSEDFFAFVYDLIYLSEHYVRFKKAQTKPYFEDGLECIYYNEVNGLTNQLYVILAAVRPRDIASDAKHKARLVANYLDRLYVSRMLNDEPLTARDFEAAYRGLIPGLRQCETEQEVAELLNRALPDEDFAAIHNFRLRGNNKAQVRYLLARLTAYVETGCGKQDMSADYLAEDRAWQVEHLWPNHPEWYRDEIADPQDFLVLRSRIGSLVLLHRKDNASLSDMRFRDKIQRYSRQNNLTAILHPDHRRNNTFVRDFVHKNGLADHFHDFGPNPRMQPVESSRTTLYRLLCQRIWRPGRLGFPVTEQLAPSPSTRQEEEPSPARRRPTPNPRTTISRLIKHGVLPEDVRIIAQNTAYEATVDRDGIIWLPTGDAFVNLDEAGMAISESQKKCDGLNFWRVAQSDGSTLPLREIRDQANAKGLLTSQRRR